MTIFHKQSLPYTVLVDIYFKVMIITIIFEQDNTLLKIA